MAISTSLLWRLTGQPEAIDVVWPYALGQWCVAQTQGSLRYISMQY